MASNLEGDAREKRVDPGRLEQPSSGVLVACAVRHRKKGLIEWKTWSVGPDLGRVDKSSPTAVRRSELPKQLPLCSELPVAACGPDTIFGRIRLTSSGRFGLPKYFERHNFSRLVSRLLESSLQNDCFMTSS